MRISRVCLWALSAVLMMSSSQAKKAPSSPPQGSSGSASGPTVKDPVRRDPVWGEAETLIGEQKYDAALTVTKKILAQARQDKNSKLIGEALVRATVLHVGLSGFETAVVFLRTEAWPQTASERVLLNLFYGHALLNYSRMYGWEIRQREKTVTTEKVDLKAWTLLQLSEEIGKAFQAALADDGLMGAPMPDYFRPYILENTYPAGVRPTLRDAVVYLSSGFLADTSFWRPTDAAESYRLPLSKLAMGVGLPAKVAMGDETVHPLVRMAWLLDQHARSHQQAGRRDAALEARYELLRRLHAAVDQTGDRRLIQDALAAWQRKAETKSLAWWSQGQALLGRWIKDAAADSQSQLEALREAQAGIQNKASSADYGVASCLDLRSDILRPSLSIESMKVDGAGQRSILVEHKDLSRIYLRAYKVDLEKQIQSQPHHNFWTLWDADPLNAILGGRFGSPVATWKMDLPTTGDHRPHRSFTVPPLQEPSGYFIVASANEKFERSRESAVVFSNLLISDLVMVAQHSRDGSLEVQTLSGATGKPVAGVQVTGYGMQSQGWSKPSVERSRGVTGADGRLILERGWLAKLPQMFGQEAMVFPVAKQGAHFAFVAGQFRLDRNTEAEKKYEDIFIYTDRSVFRPEQKVFFKVLGFEGKMQTGQYKVTVGRKVEVTLRDSNYEVVGTKSLTTNEFGTAAGEFQIPAGRALGNWQLVARFDKGQEGLRNGATSIQVEEYKRPTFEAQFLPNAKQLRLNQKAVMKAEARYYFGLPVTAGKVAWRIQRSTVMPWWFFWRGNFNSQPQVVATGTSKLGADGTFEVEFLPTADEREAKSKPGVTYLFSVEADVTDEGGETRQAQKSFRLGFVALEARFAFAQEFFAPASQIEIPVTLTDLEGEGRKGTGQWKIVLLNQPAKTALPADLPRSGHMGVDTSAMKNEGGPIQKAQGPLAGDGQRSRWETDVDWKSITAEWKEGTESARGSLSHDAKGQANIKIDKGLAAGSYRLVYESKDSFGAALKVSQDFFVVGKKPKIALPLLIQTEKSVVKVGETARLLVHSGLDAQNLVVDIYRAGTRFRRIDLPSASMSAVIEIPVTEADRGGFSYRIYGVRDYQLLQGSGSFHVPWDNKELKVEIASFRDKIRPGTQESLRVTVKDPKGKALPAKTAELVGYMYDRSLDFFRPHTVPQVMGIYPSRQGLPQFDHGLGSIQQYSGEQFVISYKAKTYLENRFQFFDRYGIGGPGGRGSRMLMKTSIGANSAPPMEDMAMEASRSDEGVAPSSASLARAEVQQEKSREDANAGSAKAEGKSNTASKSEARPSEVPLRSDFSETAFWRPQLILGADSSISFEFKVPDSLTAWSLFVHASDKEMRSGTATARARSVKDLMVRPYVPRFFREGDAAEVKVQIDNAGDTPLKGELSFAIEDAATGRSAVADFGLAAADLKRTFSAAKNASSSLSFKLRAPKHVGSYAFKVVASAKGISDGERRLVPVLPSRMHLAQSRFVTLRNKDQKKMEFPDMRQKDESLIHDRMVVTIDAQLFYGVLQSLPYLVTYPYECSEQTLNRFLSTGIVSSVFAKYPAVAAMAKEFSKRQTQLQAFNGTDANQRMTMEESPWLMESKGGARDTDILVNVLDARIAKAERDRSLAKLRKMQLPDGGFPWFEGGRDSEYMTMYLLLGFARAQEFGIDVPKDMITRAWGYLKIWVQRELNESISKDGCHEMVTLLTYILSSYPDDTWTGNLFDAAERLRLLNYAFKNWKQNSPLLKGYLALSLSRTARKEDARLVWSSVMDSAKSNAEQGTFWAPEERSWLWYNDDIESHAFALRVQMELAPQDTKNDGLVQWLFLNKKMSHWKSTRATAEAIYSLVHFLEKTKALGVREEVRVETAGLKQSFIFEPSKYTGAKNQIVIEGSKINPATASVIQVEKSTPGFAFASATWHYSTEQMPKESRGDFMSVSRKYFLRQNNGREWVLKPLTEGMKLKVGDQLEVQLSLQTKHAAEYVHLRDPRGSGFEPEVQVSGFKYDLGIERYEEIRDSGANFFFSWLPVGEYTFKYRVRANMAGQFRVGPATLQSLYAPEFNAFSAGQILMVEPAK